ncbi:MAG: MBL fold metallo-hydrolase [Defluviitaleaceae bacterium]|nr:MBL fold metallo-hydrolase [Defluviitaleaceae bacterium]
MQIKKISDRNILFCTKENADADVYMGVILGVKHNFIIDTGIGRDCVDAMLEYIGDDPKPIVVINTHHDWDHTGGNWVLEGSTIVAHKLCYELMEKNWDMQVQRAKDAGQYFTGEVRKFPPNLLFEGVMHFPEDGITIFHTPGHTEDSITVYDAVDKVLHAGDNFGVADGKAYYWGKQEDTVSFCNIIEAYKQYDFEIYASGHCEPHTKEVIGFMETALAELESK